MIDLPLGDITDKKHITVRKDTPFNDIVHLLKTSGPGIVVVIDEGMVLGVVTAGDALKVFDNSGDNDKTAADIMSSRYVTATEDSPAGFALKLLIESEAEAVVVMDAGGFVSGVANRDNMLTLLNREIKVSNEILNLFPGILLEAIDSNVGLLITGANKTAVSRFGPGILGGSLKEIFPEDEIRRITAAASSRGRIENIRIKNSSGEFDVSGLLYRENGVTASRRLHMVLRDVTDELLLATSDPLTGLYNKRFIHEFLVKEIERSRRLNSQFSIAISDLDDFRQINDSLGYLFGDRVLQAFAGMIGASVRNHDVAGRCGDDYFIIILPEASSETAYGIMERLRDRMGRESIEVLEGEDINITASFGIATFPADALSSDELIIIAGERLNRARRHGKNKIACT